MTHSLTHALISYSLPPKINLFLLIYDPFPQSASPVKQKFLNFYAPSPTLNLQSFFSLALFCPLISARLRWTAFEESACGLLLISLSCHSALLSHRLTVA